MKFIKRIDEFRTVGFKYSEPDLKFLISCYYFSDIDKEEIYENLTDILKSRTVKFNNIKIEENKGVIEVSSDDENSIEYDVDGRITFDLFLYDEKEIETIIEETSMLLKSMFNIDTYEYTINGYRGNLSK